MTEELLKRLDSYSDLEPGWYANVGKRTGEQCCEAMREAAALIRQLKADNERMREGFERQTENMAFILNHATLPEQWYEKFRRELEEDRGFNWRPNTTVAPLAARAAQSLNQTERD